MTIITPAAVMKQIMAFDLLKYKHLSDSAYVLCLTMGKPTYEN